jgi:hypothetical protein
MTSRIHQKFAKDIIQEQNRLLESLKDFELFGVIVEKRWRKLNFGYLAFNSFNDQLISLVRTPFDKIEKGLFLIFDLGFLHKKQQIESNNEILAQGFASFKQVFEINKSSVRVYDEEVSVESAV